MKIAHFARFAPFASGQYGTVRDLILAERSIGIDAQFIDCGTDAKGTIRVGLEDREIKTMPLEWVMENADIAIRHTSVPDDVYKKIPVILGLHGRPENSFLLDKYDISPSISTIRNTVINGIYADVFTFWEEHVFFWKWITHGQEIKYIPSLVDFDEYDICGKKHDFGKFSGDLNIVVADMWREDRTPFNLIFSAQLFKEKYNKGAKLHVYGAPVRKKCMSFLGSLQNNGVIGEVGGVIANLPEIYRSADILLTPNIIATRVIREAMASGLSIVSPHGCKYTQYNAEPLDIESFASEINRCSKEISTSKRIKIRERAMSLFDKKTTANAVLNMCEKVLSKKFYGVRWSAMSIRQKDWEVIERILDEYNVKSVVEFGTGISTKLFETRDDLEITSLETEQKNIDRFVKELKRTNLFLWDGKTTHKFKADMALIDGPHKGINREPSYKSVYESDIPIVICHDYHREEDRKWVNKYFKDWEVINCELKEMIILKRTLN